MSIEISVLVATRNREDLLVNRALRSVVDQTIESDRIVVVADGIPLSDGCFRKIDDILAPRKWCVIFNDRSPGVSGALNTGLSFLRKGCFSGFVAFLDDDDSWDSDHLEVNCTCAMEAKANIVVSGLRMLDNGNVVERPFIEVLNPRDFLVGNPGWQGSNTFVDFSLLLKTGGFDETLKSMNDRDLAIRLLRCPIARPMLVREWTASWHFGTQGSLSARGAPAKLAGLSRFWQIYGSEMTQGGTIGFL